MKKKLTKIEAHYYDYYLTVADDHKRMAKQQEVNGSFRAAAIFRLDAVIAYKTAFIIKNSAEVFTEEDIVQANLDLYQFTDYEITKF